MHSASDDASRLLTIGSVTVAFLLWIASLAKFWTSLRGSTVLTLALRECLDGIEHDLRPKCRVGQVGVFLR